MYINMWLKWREGAANYTIYKKCPKLRDIVKLTIIILSAHGGSLLFKL